MRVRTDTEQSADGGDEHGQDARVVHEVGAQQQVRLLGRELSLLHPVHLEHLHRRAGAGCSGGSGVGEHAGLEAQLAQLLIDRLCCDNGRVLV